LLACKISIDLKEQTSLAVLGLVGALIDLDQEGSGHETRSVTAYAARLTLHKSGNLSLYKHGLSADATVCPGVKAELLEANVGHQIKK